MDCDLLRGTACEATINHHPRLTSRRLRETWPDSGKQEHSLWRFWVRENATFDHYDLVLVNECNGSDFSQRQCEKEALILIWFSSAVFLGFLWMLLVVAYGQRDSNAYYLTDHIRQSFEPDISESMNYNDVFNWAKYTLLENLFGKYPGTFIIFILNEYVKCIPYLCNPMLPFVVKYRTRKRRYFEEC